MTVATPQTGSALAGATTTRQITNAVHDGNLARHLHACGERPVLEALLAVDPGQPLDDVLEGFARLSPEIYKATGADRLPIDDIVIIDGDVP
jgi:hypothetical protein